nr:MAG TPA: protein of unknown function (DUF5465) [Caudoviricetes sp.]
MFPHTNMSIRHTKCSLVSCGDYSSSVKEIDIYNP